MAHEVSQMAYVKRNQKDIPWHGLGNALSPRQPIDIWKQQAGMDWHIHETPVQYMPQNAALDKMQASPVLQTFEGQKVLYRSDTSEPLSVVSNRYQIVQPGEILEFYKDLTDSAGYELETAGILKGGRKFWALASTGQSTAIKGKDIVNGYLLLATSCDGTLATVATPTTVRVVCNNTLAIAMQQSLKEGQNGFKSASIRVPHNTKFDGELIKRRLGIAVSHWDEFMYQMKTLSGRKVKDSEAQAFFRQVMCEDKTHAPIPAQAYQQNQPGVPLLSPHTQISAANSSVFNLASATGPTSKSAFASYGSQKVGRAYLNEERMLGSINALYQGHGRGAEIAAAKGSAWGLLCAVTEYVDHERRARNTDNRLDSAWFGQGAQIKQRALDGALQLIA